MKKEIMPGVDVWVCDEAVEINFDYLNVFLKKNKNIKFVHISTEQLPNGVTRFRHKVLPK